MNKLKFTLLIFLTGLVTLVNGQDLNAAGAKFNEGLELDKAKNYSGAIKAWEESISICNKIGFEADQLKATVQKPLAYTYFKEGITLYKKKKFDDAAKALKNAVKNADEVGDAKTSKQASTYIPKIYSSKGLSLLVKKDYNGALKVFDEAIGYNPKCVDAFYGKGMTYKEMDQLDKASEAFDQVIKFGATNKSAAKKVESAKEAAQKMFEAKAATELQIEHNTEAVALLDKALKYSQSSPNTFYLLTLANNKMKKWDATIEAGQKALTLAGVDVSAVNFELGKAFEGKQDKANACAAYKKVTDGPNVDAAKFQIKEVLKCN
ncbi:MAG: tetratricopeptide repeat protein [Bacteroidales bacterium]|nr:tetratricopeptide repeat protein [Bacteroidales bacterium]